MIELLNLDLEQKNVRWWRYDSCIEWQFYGYWLQLSDVQKAEPFRGYVATALQWKLLNAGTSGEFFLHRCMFIESCLQHVIATRKRTVSGLKGVNIHFGRIIGVIAAKKISCQFVSDNDSILTGCNTSIWWCVSVMTNDFSRNTCWLFSHSPFKRLNQQLFTEWTCRRNRYLRLVACCGFCTILMSQSRRTDFIQTDHCMSGSRADSWISNNVDRWFCRCD